MKLAASVSVVFLALGAASSNSLAVPSSPSPLRFAQEVDPLCRQVSPNLDRGLAIRLDPSPNSRAIANVAPNERLQLAANAEAIRGPEGNTWLAVSFPAEGYVDNGPPGTSHLNRCQAFLWDAPGSPDVAPMTDSGPRDGNSCRRVIHDEGLTVRQAPSVDASILGGVEMNQEIRVRLPIRPIVASDDRQWIEITAPFNGYVSNGFGDGVSNLGACL
ncbi:MAG: hypothetical protein HLUCCO16_14075 [Phormidium sp. OSCR]|nr:MAG: hypothetical protein HLUCCO16_14075 [Phormidium sp. OSCR]